MITNIKKEDNDLRFTIRLRFTITFRTMKTGLCIMQNAMQTPHHTAHHTMLLCGRSPSPIAELGRGTLRRLIPSLFPNKYSGLNSGLLMMYKW